MTAPVLIDDLLFTGPRERPQLVGSRCTECGTHTFPAQDGCPRCTGTAMEKTPLSRRGTLWTWTIQGFPPKAPPYAGETGPAKFEPFGVGYVELSGQLKVEARLTEHDPARLRIGMEMELVLVPLSTDDAGRQVVTYAFAPVSDQRDDGGQP